MKQKSFLIFAAVLTVTLIAYATDLTFSNAPQTNSSATELQQRMAVDIHTIATTGISANTTTSPIPMPVTAVTPIPISAASLPLPSNAAQETGGNLASIKADVDKIPASPATNTGEDATNGAIAVVQKKIAASTYAPSAFKDLGSNATANVKASGGNVYSIYCHNSNASNRYLQLHNTATTPSGGATPTESFLVPAGQAIVIGTDYFTNEGENFSTGIAFAFSTTETTYTAGTASDQVTTVKYK